MLRFTQNEAYENVRVKTIVFFVKLKLTFYTPNIHHKTFFFVWEGV